MALTLASVVALGSSACDGQVGRDGVLDGESTSAQEQPNTTPFDGGESGPRPTPDGGPGPDEGREPIGNLIASPDNALCDFVPNGTLEGDDALQVSFFILLIGANPDDLPGLVSVNSDASSGASVTYRSAVSNQARTVAAIPVGSGDFGAELTATIAVDAPDEVPETDESDNRIGVSVRLPASRPSSAMELPCTIRSA